MQGPVSVKRRADEARSVLQSPGAIGRLGRESLSLAQHVGDIYLTLNPARGALLALKGFKTMRQGRKTFEAGRLAYMSGKGHQARARMLNEAWKSGAPVGRKQVRDAVSAANKQFSKARKMRSTSSLQNHRGRKQVKQGYNRMRSVPAMMNPPEPLQANPLVDKEGRLIHQGYESLRDLGKLRAQQRMAGRTRVIENGKLAKVGGRQMWRTPDGYIETERTMTVQREDGRWVNIPSFNPRTGLDYGSEAAALEGAKREGRGETSYSDARSAEIAAEAKSRRLGEELRKRGY